MKVLSTFLILSLTAAVASAWEMVIPPQGISRLTHYPTWRIPAPGWDPQQLETVTVFSVIGSFLAMLVVMKFELLVKKHHVKTIRDTYNANSRLFSSSISFYLVATFLSVFGFWVLDLGKVWSTVGTLHNLLELTILLVMLFSRYPAGFKYFYAFLFVYFILTEWLNMILKWPFDAIFFKFQGLATDFALSVNLIRLYLVNKRDPVSESEAEANHARSSSVEELEVDEETPLINNTANSFEAPRHNHGRKILSSILPNGRGSHSNGHANPNSNGTATPTGYSSLANSGSAPPATPAPESYQTLRLLVLASLIHSVGNTITTLNDGFLYFLIFQFSYGVAYPIYAYYVALVPEDHRIRWFDASVKSEALVAVGSIVASGVVIGISTFLTLRKYGKHDDFTVTGY